MGEPNNLKFWEPKKTKGPKQDRHNRLGSPMSEGGEPYLLIRVRACVRARARVCVCVCLCVCAEF